MIKTLSSVKIIKIEKIQNMVSWNMYSADLGGSMLKNVNQLAEKKLFHGSSSNPPHIIYESDEGFDIRYSN